MALGRTHAGVASTAFKALSDNEINIQMISTSEIKITIVIKEGALESAVKALHSAFELEKNNVRYCPKKLHHC